ncbi:MAG: hypothetical protein RMJ07_07240, partial [Nitrososphaerota archaeon]|nr:hypothetical protein [Nitrososphaerota archaeon]
EEGFQKKVLTASAPENFFWHSTEAQGHVFIQEYGCSPTGIYVSKDLENWRRIASNVELDRHSRHFHSIAWDPCRNWLLASLGDGCLARVVQSEDLGQSWKILYRGAWQFIPIVACEDKVIFGMDSGIAKGGVGIFHPENCCWEFKFFKWLKGKSLSAQMCDLKLLNNSLWIAAFGVPQAIALSRDLRTWYPVHIESYGGNFNFHMLIGETGNAVLCSTGNHLIAVGKDELDLVVMSKNSIASPYKAYKERLDGFIFILKRKIKNKRLGHD